MHYYDIPNNFEVDRYGAIAGARPESGQMNIKSFLRNLVLQREESNMRKEDLLQRM